VARSGIAAWPIRGFYRFSIAGDWTVRHFADRLHEAILDRRTPAMVGLDPQWDMLPQPVRTARSRDDGQAVARDYEVFCRGVIDVVAGRVAIVKPQSAFFEQLGPPGMTVLKDLIGYARSKGLLVLLDAKRGDIGSTAVAYARGYLGDEASAWAADALTIHPYLGDDAMQPFVDVARASGTGVFVLVKTSNPGGKRLQDLIADGRPVYRHVAEYVEHQAAETSGACGYGFVGAVVGATYPEQLAELRDAMPHTWFLVPGFGAQGADAANVAAAFDSRGSGAVVNNSRGILYAHSRAPYAGRYGDARWQDAVAAATDDMIDQLRSVTAVGNR
jgi:orotidine-5'-phosphate decarboxylase